MFHIYRRELNYIGKNKALAIITFIMPVLWAVILFLVFSEQQIKNQPTGILNLDKSPMSRSLAESNINASPVFNVKYHPGSIAESKQLFDADKIQALFIIPKDFEKNIKNGKPTKIIAEINYTNLAMGSVLSLNAGELLGKLSGGIELQVRTHTQSAEEALAAVQPVSESFHFINNPAFSGNYSLFLAFGMFLNCIMVAAMYYPTRGLFREYKDHIITEYHKCPFPFRLLLGKTLAYLTVIFPGAILGLQTCVLLCHIPMHASIWQAWGLTLWFCVICIWIGMSIPVLFGNQEFGFTVTAVTFMPGFIVSGFTWPEYMMPDIIKIFASIMPLKYYIFAMRDIAYQQVLQYNILPYIHGLLLWTSASLALAYAMTLVIIYRTEDKNAE